MFVAGNTAVVPAIVSSQPGYGQGVHQASAGVGFCYRESQKKEKSFLIKLSEMKSGRQLDSDRDI